MLSERLIHYRKKNKMSQKELSVSLNVSYKRISDWENGKEEIPICMLVPLARVFKISVDELLFIGKIMDEEERNRLRKQLILMISSKSCKEIKEYVEMHVKQYPDDNQLYLMIATTLLLSNNEDLLSYGLDLLNGVESYDCDFMRSVAYIKALIYHLLGNDEKSEQVLNEQDWLLLDPFPLYAKIYHDSKRKQFLKNRLHYHISHATSILSELKE